MARSLTSQSFAVPSQALLDNTEFSDKLACLSEAKYSYETKLSKLEHEFESKAAELREQYLAIILQIHKSPERGV